VIVDAPDIKESTREERAAFVNKRFPCISDCDSCGICATFHGLDAFVALADYIAGKQDYLSVPSRYRH
jgi:hypothetical protein